MRQRHRFIDMDHCKSRNYAAVHADLANDLILKRLAAEPTKRQRHALDSAAFRERGEYDPAGDLSV